MTITAGQLEALMTQAEVVEPGQEFVREGEASRELMLLLQGRVQVLREGEVVSTLVEPGTFMGVLAFFSDGVRSATLRAESRTHLLRIPPSRIPALIESTPSLGIRLLENVAQLFVETSRRSMRVEAERNENHEAVVALMSVYFPVLALLAVDDAEGEAAHEFEFAHATRGAHREHVLVLLVGDDEKTVLLCDAKH